MTFFLFYCKIERRTKEYNVPSFHQSTILSYYSSSIIIMLNLIWRGLLDRMKRNTMDPQFFFFKLNPNLIVNQKKYFSSSFSFVVKFEVVQMNFFVTSQKLFFQLNYILVSTNIINSFSLLITMCLNEDNLI